MRKLFLPVLLVLALRMAAQSPRLINYQGSLRDVSNVQLANKNFSIRFQLKQGSNGTLVYTEEQTITTNDLGLFATQIGKNNQAGMAGLNLSAGDLSLLVAIDTTGGKNYSELGDPQQLVSVPFSLYALTVPSSYSANVLSIGERTYNIGGQLQSSSAGIASVTTSGLNFTVDVPPPSLTSNGNTVTLNQGTVVTSATIGAVPPNLTLSGVGNNSLSAGSNSVVLNTYTTGTGLSMSGGGTSYTLSAISTTFQTQGIASVSPQSGTLITVSVPGPTLSYANNILTVNQGTSVSTATITTPALTLTGAGNNSLTAGTNTVVLNTYTAGNGLSLSGVVPNQTLSANTTGTNAVWGALGNAGTNTLTNFIGTTDANDLRFRVNNVRAGIVQQASQGNTYFGYLTGPNNPTTMNGNVGIGYTVLGANTTGVRNIGIGYNVLSSNNTGAYNIGLGGASNLNNTTGDNNIGIGYQAIRDNTAGSNNIGIGMSALGVVQGSANIGIAAGALGLNTSGSNNVTIGYQSGNSNVSGSGNVFLGHRSGFFEMGSDKLYISNSSTSVTPLIYGDFATGRVSINSTVSTEALNVGGNMRVSGAIMPNNLAGTSGQVLTSQGTGVAPIWTTAASGWGLTGNAGTTPGLNFVGTTDGNPLIFRVNNTQSGKIETNLTGNIAFGYQSSTSASGGGNSAFGYRTLLSATNGSWNAAFGCNALSSGQNVHYNTAVGVDALTSNVNGPGNTGIGYSAMAGNVSGGFNVGVGNLALWSSTGDYNVGIGNQAYGSSGVTGSSNTAVGHQALSASVGSSGSKNAAFGSQALFSISSGSGNVGVGNLAGLSNSTGNNNVFLGSNSNASSAGLSNVVAIGANATVTASNRVKLGNAANVEFDLALMPAGNAGTLGQVLQSSGAGAAPVWTTAASSGWGLTGNAGTTPSLNFVGTIDNLPLNFRVNNQKAGGIENTTYNTFLGYQSGNVVTGTENTGMGWSALTKNTNGGTNTGLGATALFSNTIGSANTGVGYAALYNNTNGGENTALGAIAMQQNTTGNGNTGIGRVALNNNTSGSLNTAVGHSALLANTTGNFNTAIGWVANVITGTLTNASAIGAGAKVGSSNSMVLGDTSNIKVGIGTGYPSSKLHVKGAVRIVDGTQATGKVLTSDANGNASWQSATTSTASSCILKDYKSNGTAGGQFISGAWRTRDLNAVEGNSALVNLSGNQFTLQPGTYYISAQAPAMGVASHKAKLRNITDNADAVLGQSTYAAVPGSYGMNFSNITGFVTISSQKVFEIQHQCQSTSVGGDGLGVPNSFGTQELYTQVHITKLQ